MRLYAREESPFAHPNHFLFCQSLNMMTRLTTIFLLLTLIAPVGALGAVSHRCGMDDSVHQKYCKHNKLNGQSASDASGTQTKQCSLSSAPDKLPPAATDYKPRIDKSQSADIPSSFVAPLRSPEVSSQTFSPALLHSAKSGPPLFIRLCSLLN